MSPFFTVFFYRRASLSKNRISFSETWAKLLVTLVGVFERNGPEKGAGLPSILGSSNLFPDEIIFVVLDLFM